MSNPDQLAADEGRLAPGTKLGKYEIVRLLGSGGMGAVYEALHTGLAKRVAIKTLNASIAAVPGARARFLREAELTSRVQHPHIVDVTDMGTEDGHTFLVMELLRGEDLSARLARGRLDAAELAAIMLPVISAVAAAHAASIVHRDLKPQNVFLARTATGAIHPTVLDFGISKETDPSVSTLTATGSMVGTPHYLAPEQLESAKAAGPASDQYAIGVIMYEGLTGRRPFHGETIYQIFNAIAAGRAPSLAEARPDLPPALLAVVERAMARDSAARFPSLRHLGLALLPFADARTRMTWEAAFAKAPQPGDDVVVDMPTSASGGVSTPVDVSSTSPLGTDAFGMASTTARVNEPTRWGRVVGASAALVAVIAVAFVLLRRASVEEPPRGVPAVVTPPVAAAGVKPAPEPLRVRVDVSPADAVIELDGARAGTGRVDQTFPRDGKSHRLRVSAEGYIPYVLEFTDTAPPARVELEQLPASPPPPKREATRGPSRRERTKLGPNGAPLIE